MIVPGMFVCSSFLISVCMFIVSKALFISSATVIVRAGGAIWFNPFATVLFSVCSAVNVECCVICDSTSTSNTNNVKIIQAQLNKLTVTSVYKPPNEQFSFGSNLASTQMNVVICDFNSYGVEWGYRSTDENG